MFFSLSKILWWFVSPGNIILFVLCLATVLLFIRRQRLARWLFGILAVSAVFISTIPIGSWMITSLENRFPAVDTPPKHIDGVIVLGGVANQIVTHARGQVAISDAAERLTALAHLGYQYPEARLVFSGGSGLLFNQELKEGDVIAPLLKDIGFDPDRVEIENRARNTFENALITREFVKPKASETWLLVTSAFHMPRAVGCFRKVGWESIVPYPVDFRSTGIYVPTSIPQFSSRMSELELAIHEWLGLFFYWLTDRIDEPFPQPR